MLDKLTGLPEVPEGYWWRVTRERQQVSGWDPYPSVQNGGLSSTGWSYRMVGIVSLMTTEYRTGPSHWYTKAKPQTVEVARYRHTIRIKADSSNYNYEITPHSILRTAVGIMASWEADKKLKAQQRAVDSLMGDYPPKRLGQ